MTRARLRSRDVLKWVMRHPARGDAFTIRELAEAAGLKHHSSLGHLLTGERECISKHDATRIAEVAGCGVRTLFDLTESTNGDESSPGKPPLEGDSNA